MTAPVVPLIMTAIFVGGCIIIQKSQKWATEVTEGFAFLLATIAVTIVALLLVQTWPRLYANSDVPLIAAVALSGEADHDMRSSVANAGRHNAEKLLTEHASAR